MFNSTKKFVRTHKTAIALVAVTAVSAYVIRYQHVCIVEALELLEENNIEIPS